MSWVILFPIFCKNCSLLLGKIVKFSQKSSPFSFFSKNVFGLNFDHEFRSLLKLFWFLPSFFRKRFETSSKKILHFENVWKFLSA
ncbi:hypothetical protein DPV73_09390 [Leptospira mayottensis]|nr:hypothetical protein DPV73_09390 [Leptospira mayottensis]